MVDEPSRGKYLRACPVAVAAWIDEHGGRGLKSDSSLSNWRLGKGSNGPTRRAVERVLDALGRKEAVDAVECLVREDTGPGKRWRLCLHYGAGEEIDHCPNRGDVKASGAAPERSFATEPDSAMAASGTTIPSTRGLSPEELASYREAVRARYGIKRFIGMAIPFKYGVAWEDLYVELDMVEDHGHTKQDSFEEPGPEGTIRKESKTLGLKAAFGYADRHKTHAMVLLGHPGSGKTTQLQQMLLRVLGEGLESLGLPPGTLPVFVAIRDLRLPTKANQDDEEPWLEDLVRQRLPRDLGQASEDFVDRLLKHHQVLYLLDGLDEIPVEAERIRMANVIESARLRLGNDWMVVSSRYAGYADVKDVHLSDEFLELKLKSLDDAQIGRMVHNWHQAVEEVEADTEERAASPDAAKARAGALLERILAPSSRRNELSQLASTPLLLTVLCLIHHTRGSAGGLPTNRSEIYATCEEILLEHWQREARRSRDRPVETRIKLDADTARRVLQPVAYWLHHEEERRDATVAELREPVQQGLHAVDRRDVPAEGFVRSFASESGLLTPYGPERHGFIHLGFQEHLAALHVRERWEEQESEVLANLVGRRGEGWWREVSRMALEQGTPGLLEAFIERVARGSELEAWSRTRMMAESVRASAAASVGPLEAVLREPVGVVSEGRQLAAVRLLVHWVLPRVPAMEERLDALLREHPVEAVRRRWLTRAKRVEAGTPRLVEKAGVVLMPIPGGWFSMGSAQDDDAAWEAEKPQHEVELERFWLARTPVTNAQYRSFLEAPDRDPKVTEPEYWGDRRYNKDDQPVIGVSWDEARAFCTWAGLRLPTEAEWEYACRAGTTTRYCSGESEEDLARAGWYDANSGDRLHAVGELEPNGFGLYDMHGNVWEWCEDAFGSYATSAHAGDGLRHQPVGVANRVIRGGCFRNPARSARSAYRILWHPANRNNGLGFRPAQGHP